jgi:hypothetical protein
MNVTTNGGIKMKENYKFKVVGSLHNNQGKILSKHNSKKAARESAKKYWHKGYSGAIWTRKKMTPVIQNRLKKYGISEQKYHYVADNRKRDFF